MRQPNRQCHQVLTRESCVKNVWHCLKRQKKNDSQKTQQCLVNTKNCSCCILRFSFDSKTSEKFMPPNSQLPAFRVEQKKKTTKATFGVRENQSLHHNLWKGLKKIKSTERKRLGTLLHTLKGLLRGTCSKPFFQLWQVMGTFWKISFLSDSVCCYQWPYSRLGSEWDRSREDEGAPRPHRGSRGALPRDSGLSSPISFCSVARSSTLPARLDPLAPHSPALPDQSNLAAPIHLPGKWGFLQKLSF